MRQRIRTVKPEMWQDERIVALSRDARLALLAMITMADDEGRFRIRRSQIIGHAFPADNDADALVDKWINEIKKQGIVLFYLADGTPYGAFRNWRRHQVINKPTRSALPPPPDPKVVRENSVKPPVVVTGIQVSTSCSRAVPIPSLCYRLASHIQRNDPKAKPRADSAQWQTDMRLLLKDRKGDVEEVERVIDWCQADKFWRGNILSPGKLRKQFTNLLLQSQKSNISSIGRSRAAEKLDVWKATRDGGAS